MVNGKFQTIKIKEQQVFGSASGTYTVDLPTSNYLQGLNLRIQNTNGSTSNTATAQTIASCISKIEITADGVPVYSCSGEEARMIEHFDSGHLPPFNETQVGSAVQYAVFPLKFGRNKNDKQIILPAHMFTTLQLKITFAFTDSTTVGFTTSSSNAKFDLIGRYLISKTDVLNTPFLKRISVYSKTLNTIQLEEVELPVGAGNGAYRRIFLRAYEAGIEDGVDIDKYELLLNDSQRLIDERWDTSQMEDDLRYGATTRKDITAFMKNNDTLATKVSRVRSIVASSGADAHNACFDGVAGDTITLSLFDLATPTAVSSAEAVDVTLVGEGVSYSTVMDLGTDDYDDCLDVGKGSQVTSLKVRLNVAAAGASTSVVTEQLVVF